MSKTQKRLKKNIKKVKEQEKKEYPIKNQILYFSKILATILILAILVSAITMIKNGTYKMDDADPVIDYKTILAGQTFSKGSEEYYVVFYKDNSMIETIEGIKTKTIYKVDLNSAFNNSVISDESNKDAQSVTDLKINGTTLIKIEDGKNTLYIEGTDQVTTYLKKL